VSPSRQAGGRGDEEEPRPDETQEYELGEEFLDDIDDDEEVREEELADEELRKQELAQDADPDELGDEDLDEADEDEEHDEEEAELPEEDELERVVSAETQEWDGLEAAEAEAEADEPTLVASAGGRVKQAGSAITSGFEKVGGRKVTDGFKAVGSEGVKRIRRWRPGFPLWLRFLTASLVIVASIAGATSASLILYLGDIAKALEDNTIGEKVDKFLTRVDGGGPQTILILGSDKDPELKDVQKGFKGLSDTTMLLRLDPNREAISLFSLPRDLKVEIPGYGTDKLNAAYGFGGPQLTLQTVENLLSTPGQPFEVNHLVNVDFEGFARAVNAIDCVYVDVDRRYFNTNDDFGQDYEEIDIQPGYQALCGFDALDYARYRHTDNDIVRAARQQEFLREARAKIPPGRLISDRKELISIFTEHTSSDINDSQTMLQVLRLFLESRDKPVKEVRFEGALGPSFVTATPEQLQTAVRQFLGIQGTPGTAGKTAAPEEPVTPDVAPDQTPVAPAAPAGGTGEAKKKAARSEDPSLSEGVNLTRTSYGKQLAKGIRARGSKIPIFYPTVLQTGTDYAQKPRVYKINGTGEGSPPRGERAAYKWIFSRPAIGEYYGFMATRWTDPPVLDDPDDERTIKGRDYKFYFENDRLRMVAWQTDAGSFWLSNTLIESLSNNEMLRIAEGFRELGGTG
jgi:polyisoprenyl-teichoic acid--peptidoglycan teichoic acid transferase